MTEWTAGQDATVSWKSNCSDPATTLFPVNLVDLDYDDVDVPIPGPPVFHVNCIPTGSLTIKVPIAINVPGVKTQGFYHFVVFYGQARYSSQLFDIKNSSPSGTPTTTSIPINRASTSAVATTITVSSSAPKSPNSTGPLSRDSSGNGTVGNGAAIGGGIAGGVAGGVALATIILLLVLRKRQQRKHQPKPEADPPPDHVLPSIEKTRDDGEYGGYLQTEPSNKSSMKKSLLTGIKEATADLSNQQYFLDTTPEEYSVDG
ncbi:hypothetical protein BGZ83_009512 [Gryganskiella cystojenkinii]|nr:hypothetical protein BGZ83_009512 [Gryganskiella cystojenkinii]